MSTPFMHQHGTKLMQLTPTSIIHAAEADLSHMRKLKEDPYLEPRRYAFCRIQVSKATTPREFVNIALMDRDRGINSGKLETHIIYGDEDLLRAAAALGARCILIL